jgi:hypothetical protein
VKKERGAGATAVYPEEAKRGKEEKGLEEEEKEVKEGAVGTATERMSSSSSSPCC